MDLEAPMRQQLRRFWDDEGGQDLIEYSLLITFIAIACMWFVGAGRGPVNGVWTTANNHVTSAAAAAGGN
jgi:Flp pilus assembly pilin Flp